MHMTCETCQLTRTEIEAELYRLQYHNCDGCVVLKSDGAVEGKLCDKCSRAVRLENLLKRLQQNPSSVS